MNLVNRLLPKVGAAGMREALLTGQAYLHSHGVTAWQDAIVGSYGDADDPAPSYLAAARSGELTGRVVGALCGIAAAAWSRSRSWWRGGPRCTLAASPRPVSR